MAENKRQSSGAKGSQNSAATSTAGGMAANMVPVEAALSSAIGARVRITTAAPSASTLEGTLFTACPITNLVAINTAPSPPTGDAKQAQAGDYHVIPVSRIQSFQLLALPSSNPSDSPSFIDALPPIQALDTRALKAREAKAIGEAMDREALAERESPARLRICLMLSVGPCPLIGMALISWLRMRSALPLPTGLRIAVL